MIAPVLRGLRGARDARPTAPPLDGDTLKPIYNDAEEILANEIANPVILDSQGRIPAGVDVFLAGQYRLTIKEGPDSITGLSITVTSFDPIGGATGGQFEDYDNTFPYDINNIALASDGEFYRSKVTPNTGNDPASNGSPTQWEHFVLDTAALVLSGGGILTNMKVNILTDTNTYTLPAADSVAINEFLIVEVPDRYSAFTPTVQRDGTDTITDSNGPDTSVIFATLSIQSLRFTSDGSSNWSI